MPLLRWTKVTPVMWHSVQWLSSKLQKLVLKYEHSEWIHFETIKFLIDWHVCAELLTDCKQSSSDARRLRILERLRCSTVFERHPSAWNIGGYQPSDADGHFKRVVESLIVLQSNTLQSNLTWIAWKVKQMYNIKLKLTLILTR